MIFMKYTYECVSHIHLIYRCSTYNTFFLQKKIFLFTFVATKIRMILLKSCKPWVCFLDAHWRAPNISFLKWKTIVICSFLSFFLFFIFYYFDSCLRISFQLLYCYIIFHFKIKKIGFAWFTITTIKCSLSRHNYIALNLIFFQSDTHPQQMRLNIILW